MSEPVPLDPVRLEGQHVRLEPLRFAHLEALCRIGLDPELWRWTNGQVRHADDMRHYVEKALRLMRERTSLPFVTIEHATETLVGSTRFMNYSGQDRKVEIGGTFVAPAWQRTIINTEAKYLMFRHAFETLSLQRVELKTDRLNERSRAAILRIGAREEGTLRKQMITESGRVRDSVYFSVIDEEWPAVKARLEEMLGR